MSEKIGSRLRAPFFIRKPLTAFQCINQEDPDERGKQVQLMQQIYENSAEVTIFIGDGLDHRTRRSGLKHPPATPVEHLSGDHRDENFLRDFLQHIHSASLEELKSPAMASLLAIGFLRLLSNSKNLIQARTDLKMLLASARTRLFECVRALLIAPWWNRIWVVQEIAVSRVATVQFGTVSLPWTVFARAAKAISKYSNAGRFFESDHWKVLSLVERQVSNIERTRMKWHADGGNDLLRLLQEFSNRQATDDRDKVYGVLSLATNGHFIVPDYNLDTLETYRRVALTLINDNSGLTCWVGDQKRKNHKNLPSWIPDWSTAFDQADRHRMDYLTETRNSVDDSRTPHIVDKEVDYWRSAEQHAKKLLEDLTRRQSPWQILPVSLRPYLKRYVQSLKALVEVFNSKISRIHARQHSFWPRQFDHPDIGPVKATTQDLERTVGSISSLIEICGLLMDFCTAHDTEWNRNRLLKLFYRRSCGFAGETFWMHQLQLPAPNSSFLTPLQFEMLLADPILLESQKRCVTLKTTFIDSVHFVGPRVFGWQDMKASLRTLAQWLEVIQYCSNSKAMDMFARTLKGGFCRVHHTRTLHPCSWNDWLPPIQADIFEYTTSYPEDIQLATDGRVFFTTKSGRMGLGPASMQPGDFITEFPSGRTNFVLRAVRGQSSKEEWPENSLRVAVGREPREMYWGETESGFPGREDWKKGIHINNELIGDCYLDTEDNTHRSYKPVEEVVEETDACNLEGALPYELLGVGFIREWALLEEPMTTIVLV